MTPRPHRRTKAAADESGPDTAATREAPLSGRDTGRRRGRDGQVDPGSQPGAAEHSLVVPRKLRRGRGHRGWLVGLFGVATTFSLVAGSIAIATRGAEDVAHYLGTVRAWGADAYSCALLGGIALLAWAAFFGAAVRSIREAKFAPPARERPASSRQPAPAQVESAAGASDSDRAVAVGSGR